MVALWSLQRQKRFLVPAIAFLAPLALLSLTFPGLRAEEKAAFDPSRAQNSGLGMPTPYDKFLALDIALGQVKVDWKALYAQFKADIDTDNLDDLEVAVPAALGARIADGVMAIKARDAEALNESASDIEKLAELLGVPAEDMARARKVRAAANAGKWLEVFMELGFLQLDIMRQLASNGPRGDVLIITGWVQGARYTSAVILENYSAETSNFLREPLLAEALNTAAQNLPAASKETKIGKRLVEALPKMHKTIDIPLTGAISQEEVQALHDLASDVILTVVEEAR